MTLVSIAVVALGLAASYPELDSLQRKGVWAIRIQEPNLAYVYSDKQEIGEACMSSEVAYIKSGKRRWRMEEAGPSKRLAMAWCSRAKPHEFDFDVRTNIELSRLERALNRMRGEIPREPHHSKIDGKNPFQISTSGSTISFSWMGPSLDVYKLTWNPDDNSITASEYQEEVDSVEMN